jgi:hypothetical protein
MSNCYGVGWTEIGGWRAEEWSWGFISGACGENEKFGEKVCINEKVLSDGASFPLILNVRCQCYRVRLYKSELQMSLYLSARIEGERTFKTSFLYLQLIRTLNDRLNLLEQTV